jgi:hypothetical protein
MDEQKPGDPFYDPVVAKLKYHMPTPRSRVHFWNLVNNFKLHKYYEKPPPLLTREQALAALRRARETHDIMRERNPRYQMNRGDLAVIIENAKLYDRNAPDTSARAIRQRITDHIVLSGSFMKHRLKKQPTGAKKKDNKKDKDNKKGKKNPSRNQGVRNRAFHRDGKACVIQGTADPQMAHLFPFSATKDKDACNRTYGCWYVVLSLMGESFHNNYIDLVQKPLSFEFTGNLLAIGEQMHTWLDKGFWAFEPVSVPTNHKGSTFPTAVRLIWLPVCPGGTVSLEEGSDSVMQIFDILQEAYTKDFPPRIPTGTGYIGARLRNGEEVQSGQIFVINHESGGEARKFSDMVSLQWRCMRILMMRGLGDLEEEDDTDEGDDFFDIDPDPPALSPAKRKRIPSTVVPLAKVHGGVKPPPPGQPGPAPPPSTTGTPSGHGAGSGAGSGAAGRGAAGSGAAGSGAAGSGAGRGTGASK